MLCVKIYRMQAKPEVIGELRLDGKRVTTAKAKDQQDAKLLKRLLERPAIRRVGLVNDVFCERRSGTLPSSALRALQVALFLGERSGGRLT